MYYVSFHWWDSGTLGLLFSSNNSSKFLEYRWFSEHTISTENNLDFSYYSDDFAARIKAKAAAKKPPMKKLNKAEDLFDSMLGEEEKKKPEPAAKKPAPAAKKLHSSDLDSGDESDDYKPKKVGFAFDRFRILLGSEIFYDSASPYVTKSECS